MLTGLLDRISKTLQLPVASSTPPVFAESFDPDTYTRENARQIFPNLPALNCFMGVCDDGYPMLIELEQAGNGAILIISDDPDGRTDLTQMMAESTAAANASVEFKFTVIYSDEGVWKPMLNDQKLGGYILAKIPANHEKATDWILQLALLAEERSFGKRLGANIMLILDEAEFLQTADANIRSNFVWLCQYGPQFGIRPVISLSSEAALDMPELIQHIRTRIYGRMPNRAAFHLSSFSGLETENFEEDRQYIVRSENSWIHFWTPR
jgi:hypothetical protein